MYNLLLIWGKRSTHCGSVYAYAWNQRYRPVTLKLFFTYLHSWYFCSGYVEQSEVKWKIDLAMHGTPRMEQQSDQDICPRDVSNALLKVVLEMWR